VSLQVALTCLLCSSLSAINALNGKAKKERLRKDEDFERRKATRTVDVDVGKAKLSSGAATCGEREMPRYLGDNRPSGVTCLATWADHFRNPGLDITMEQ
jgi:hypothetical protein